MVCGAVIVPPLAHRYDISASPCPQPRRLSTDRPDGSRRPGRSGFREGTPKSGRPDREGQDMNEPMMTICGNVVDTPNLNKTKNGHLVANFRVASTPRRFDREKNAWVDGDTVYISVTAWRALAENVAKSLQKGHPVVVFARFRQHDY